MGDEVFVAEEPEHLLTEDEFGLMGIDVGDGMPRSVVEENPAGDDGVNVRIFHWSDDPKVWMTATMPGRALGSSMATAIISRTVS